MELPPPIKWSSTTEDIAQVSLHLEPIKLQAIQQEFQWLDNFTKSAHPSNEVDSMLCQMTSIHLKQHVEYRKSLEVCQAWRKKKYNMLFQLWWKRKQYSITLTTILKGILMALGNKNQR